MDKRDIKDIKGKSGYLIINIRKDIESTEV